MSTYRKHTRGPTNRTILPERALRGTVLVSILIPAFRYVLRTLAPVYESGSSPENPSVQPFSTVLVTADAVLLTLPVLALFGGVFVAYLRLGPLGIVSYLVLSGTATSMLAGSTLAAVTFVLVAVSVVTTSVIISTQRRGPSTRRL